MRLVILFTFLFVTGFYECQSSRLVLEYSSSGNQVLRNLEHDEGGASSSQEDREDVVEKLIKEHVRAYPVPVRDVLTVVWDAEVSSRIASFSLVDYRFNLLLDEVRPPNIYTHSIQLNVGQYLTGVYWLRVNLKTGEQVHISFTKL